MRHCRYIGIGLTMVAAGGGTGLVVAQDTRMLDVPAAVGALGAELSAHGGTVVLSWLDPLGERKQRPRYALRFTTLVDGAWTEPRTVVEGDDFFANWADFPSVVPGADGVMLAHWLAKSGSGTYAYDVVLARSTDRGEQWQQLGKLHSDDTETEHGFVSIVPHGDNFAAVWLDGRAMAEGGAMAFRAASISDRPQDSVVLDDDACTCCQTDLVATGDALLAVYRDHGAGEVRDISVVRRTAQGWTAPRAVHDDGWRIGGCPVNGPAADSDGGLLAVAWFTAAVAPLVNVAFSTDGGASFGAPITVDDDEPVGRVDVVCVPGGAIVSWLGRDDGAGAIRLRHVSADGSVGEVDVLSAASTARASGFPRMVRRGDTLILVWRDTADRPRLRSALVPIAAVPRGRPR